MVLKLIHKEKESMKKRALVVALVVVLVVSCMAPLAMARVDTWWPSLTFSGTKANCYVEVIAGKNDSVAVTLRLMHGSIQVASWYASGTGSAVIDQTVSVVKGNTYTLVATATINGEVMPVATTSATC